MSPHDLPPESRLRVVVWNMDHKLHAWSALDGLEPDICLLNEALVPKRRSGLWSATGTPALRLTPVTTAIGRACVVAEPPASVRLTLKLTCRYGAPAE